MRSLFEIYHFDVFLDDVKENPTSDGNKILQKASIWISWLVFWK